MNYKIINTAILTSQDVPKSVTRDDQFYDYLLNNSIAYYYSFHLSKEKNIIDKKIINTGDNLNRKYIKTLKLINNLCEKNKIKFLLFKTYKYVSEVVDNDIDLIIKEKDFCNFTKALGDEGFKCLEEERLKIKCLKKGLCKIEPRVNLSFRGRILADQKRIWQKQEEVIIDGMKVLKTTKEIDLLYLLLSILYTPNYLKLYYLLIYKNVDLEKLYKLSPDKNISQDLKFLLRNLTKNLEDKHFPLFLEDISFIVWWYRRIFLASDITLLKRFTLIVSFFYFKYLYVFFNKLVFKHDWSLE